MTLTAVVLAGCGATGNAGENAASQASMENETAEAPEAGKNETEETVEDAGEEDEIPRQKK